MNLVGIHWANIDLYGVCQNTQNTPTHKHGTVRTHQKEMVQAEKTGLSKAYVSRPRRGS